MNIHIAVLTMGNQANIDRLFSDLFWASVWGRVESVQVLSQVGRIEPRGRKNYFVLPALHIHHMPNNLGCAGGRKALTDLLIVMGLNRDDVIVYLDDDIEVLEHDWLMHLVEPLLCGYSISGVDGRDVTEDLMTVPVGIAPDYVSGGWCAIKGDVFLDGCMFDEQFFPNYFEDVDLCFQARAKDKAIAVRRNVGLRHEHLAGESVSKILEDNRQRFGKKWGLL